MSQLPPPSATLLTAPPRGAGVPAIELPPLSDLSLAAPPRSPDLPAVAMPKPSGTPRADPATPSEPSAPSGSRQSTADEVAKQPPVVLPSDPQPMSAGRLEAEHAAVDRDIAELMAAPLMRREQTAHHDTDHAHDAARRASEQTGPTVEQARHAAEAEWRAFEAGWDAVEEAPQAVDDWQILQPSELAPPAGARSEAALVADPPSVARGPQERALEPRRDGRRWGLRLLGVLSLVGIAVGAWFVIPIVADRATGDEAIEPAIEPTIETTTAETDTAGTDTVEIDGDDASGAVDVAQASPGPSSASGADVPVAADVDDVWLLDRGDGRYDWGAVVVSTADDVRNDLDVVATLLDADGSAVYVTEFRIVDLGPGGSGVAGGVFEADDVRPVRIELVATVAPTETVSEPDASAAGDEPSDEAEVSDIEYRVVDVRRIASGQVDRDDRLLGSIEIVPSGVDDAVEPNDGRASVLRLAVLWRDDAGAVVAAVLDEIEPLDGVSTLDFSLGLSRAVVPPGPPDDVVVSVGS